MKSHVAIYIRLSPDVAQALEDAASDAGMSKTGYVERAIRQQIERDQRTRQTRTQKDHHGTTAAHRH